MQGIIIARDICIYVKWSWRDRSLYMHRCISIHQVEATSHPRIHINKHVEWRRSSSFCYTHTCRVQRRLMACLICSHMEWRGAPQSFFAFRRYVECRVNDVMSYMYTCGMTLTMPFFIRVHVCAYTQGMNVALPSMQSKNQLNSYYHIWETTGRSQRPP